MLPLLESDCGIAASPMVVALCVAFAFTALEATREKRKLRKRQVKVYTFYVIWCDDT